MARRFVRIDLSDAARDFRPIAIEPGVPMLDRSDANARILFKWLGGLVAEPEWEAESVSFYVRDDHGGRLEEVDCSPADDADLSGPLRNDLEAIRERIAKARPETSTERAVHQALRDSFAKLTEDPDRTDRDNYFFKYRDVQGRWRLVWCWGYLRADQQPAAAVICTDPDCGILFVRRPGQSPKCPGCEALLLTGAVKRTSRRRAWLLVLILFLLAAAVLYWLLDRRRLVATPESWTGPVGSRVPFEITRPGLFGFGAKDVSREVVPVIFDHRVARFDRASCTAIARSPGKTVIRFCLGPLSSAVVLTVVGQRASQRPVAVEPPAAEVLILSDRGPAVQFPVGAEFDDFRVEARYPDGFTQLVTKAATLRSSDDPDGGPVAFSGGRMIGLRPGQTRVEADFGGISSQNALDVEVTAGAEVDEIRLTPSPVRILPGETVAMEAVGYQRGNSVGVITGLDGLAWESGSGRIVRVDGPLVTGLEPGRGTVTARLGSVTSSPAEVNVAASIADGLVVDPDVLQMLAGESRRIGTDLAVLRGETDLSRQANVTSAVPGVVRYIPETHSLEGISPGVSAVTFTAGDKLATMMVEVLPGEPLDGKVVVEPGGGSLAPGQSMPLRVYLVTEEGHRLDRTGSAVLTSSAPQTVMIRGSTACAVAPGRAEVSATLPEAELPGKAYLTVDDEPITELIVEPPQVDMSVGDLRRLRILGRAAGRLRELFPQPDLEITIGGANPEAIEMVGSLEIAATAPGNAEVTVGWAGRLSRQVPVAVTDDPLRDLAIDPARATIYQGQPLVYRVTATRGGRRLVLGPEDGVSLSVGEPDVAARAAEGLAVVGKSPGLTDVVARVGEQQAVASLEVDPGQRPAGGVVYGPDGNRVWWPGYGYNGLGYDLIYGPGGVIYDPDGQVVYTPGGKYDGLSRTATVTVTGQRFLDVRTTLNEGGENFNVTIEVLAADSEGPLEYRVYAAGEAPPETWVPSGQQGERQRAVLSGPRMPYGPPSARYNLVLEARDAGGGAVERYPFSFRLAPSIERTDSPL